MKIGGFAYFALIVVALFSVGNAHTRFMRLNRICLGMDWLLVVYESKGWLDVVNQNRAREASNDVEAR